MKVTILLVRFISALTPDVQNKPNSALVQRSFSALDEFNKTALLNARESGGYGIPKKLFKFRCKTVQFYAVLSQAFYFIPRSFSN